MIKNRFVWIIPKITDCKSHSVIFVASRQSTIIGKHDIWLAHWTNSPDRPSRYDYGQTMRQWGVEKIGGIDVDGDICFTEYAKSVPSKKSITELAREVIRGEWGNGAERKMRLTAEGYDYAEVQREVNRLLK